jgi:Skp family chaperone for outer membrane proteins
MKRFTLFVALLILAGTVVQAQTPPVQAQTPAVPPKPGAPGTGIGVIIFSTVLLESDPGKAAVESIKKAMGPKQAAYDKATEEAKEIQTKLQNAKTDAEKTSLGRELDSKARAVKLLQEDAQGLSDELQERYFSPIGMLINKIVEEYGKESNLAFVVDPSTDPSNVVFANKLNDITSEVTRRVNAAYAKDPKIVAPSAVTPAPAAPAKPQP